MTPNRNPRDFGYSPFWELLPWTRRSLTLQTAAVERPGLLRHVDYSQYNAGDMAALKNGGVPFAWFRVSYGISGIDSEGVNQALAFHAAGGWPLLYHVLLDYGGANQATQFLSAAESLLAVTGGKTIVALDQETPFADNSKRRQRSEGFCNLVRQEVSGLKTALYTNNNYALSWGLNGAWIKPAFDFTWQAQWTSGSPAQLPGWYAYALEPTRCFHQSGIYPTYWWEAPVTGITSAIDIDWYYGDLKDLQKLLGIAAEEDCATKTEFHTLSARVDALSYIAHPTHRILVSGTRFEATSDGGLVTLVGPGNPVAQVVPTTTRHNRLNVDVQITNANNAETIMRGWIALDKLAEI